jgi:hypothetical protein
MDLPAALGRSHRRYSRQRRSHKLSAAVACRLAVSIWLHSVQPARGEQSFAQIGFAEVPNGDIASTEQDRDISS